MSRQHYLPASYIGRFSLSQAGSRRRRPVFVQRFGEQPYKASAEYVARARRHYDNHAEAGGIDQSWGYEADLPRALDSLADATIPLDGRTWAQVLVPFISSLFIRGIDFEERFTSRIPGVTGPASDGSAEAPIASWHDNALAGAMIEWQRLLPVSLTAEWIVLHGSGAPILSTNDVGHCLTSPPGEPHRVAYAFPLDPARMLVLERRPARRILDWDGGRWTAPIEHRAIPDAVLMGARTALQHGAVREVYGPTLESVESADPQFRPEVGPVGPHFLLPGPRTRAMIPYLEDYFRVLTLLERTPREPLGKDIDWEIVAKHWKAPVQIATNLPMFPGGLALVGSSFYLDLTRFTIEDVIANIGTSPVAPVPTSPSPTLQRLISDEARLSPEETPPIPGSGAARRFLEWLRLRRR